MGLSTAAAATGGSKTRDSRYQRYYIYDDDILEALFFSFTVIFSLLWMII